MNVRDKIRRHGLVSLNTSSLICVPSRAAREYEDYRSSDSVSKASTTKFMCNLAYNESSVIPVARPDYQPATQQNWASRLCSAPSRTDSPSSSPHHGFRFPVSCLLSVVYVCVRLQTTIRFGLPNFLNCLSLLWHCPHPTPSTSRPSTPCTYSASSLHHGLLSFITFSLLWTNTSRSGQGVSVCLTQLCSNSFLRIYPNYSLHVSVVRLSSCGNIYIGNYH
jgi:hypothetical protein